MIDWAREGPIDASAFGPVSRTYFTPYPKEWSMYWLEGHIEAWWVNGATDDAERVPVMVLGSIDASKLLVCRGDTGDLTVVPMDKVKLGWRYDFGARKWVDLDHAEEEANGDAPDGEG